MKRLLIAAIVLLGSATAAEAHGGGFRTPVRNFLFAPRVQRVVVAPQRFVHVAPFRAPLVVQPFYQQQIVVPQSFSYGLQLQQGGCGQLFIR